MSAKYTYRALAYNAGNPIKKLILIVMADIADNDGFCFPSNATIAKNCGVSESTVKSHINGLVDAGIIIKKPRFNGGTQTSNMFKLCLPMTEYECNTPAENKPHPRQDLTPPPSGSGYESTQLTYSINNKDIVEQARQCLEYLNEKANRSYKNTTASHISNISARLKDGFTIDEIKSVIDTMCEQWGNNEKMIQYLRPSTLFNTEKFQGYLALAKSKPMDFRNPTKTQDYSKGWK